MVYMKLLQAILEGFIGACLLFLFFYCLLAFGIVFVN